MKKTKILILSILLSIATIIAIVYAAQDFYRVDNATEVTIDEHSVCKKVDNTSWNDYFIPTKTALEWQSFRDNLPPGVVLNECSSSFCSMTLTVPNVGNSILSWTLPLPPWKQVIWVTKDWTLNLTEIVPTTLCIAIWATDHCLANTVFRDYNSIYRTTPEWWDSYHSAALFTTNWEYKIGQEYHYGTYDILYACAPATDQWTDLDPNCDIPDITIWYQTWAGCNSTLWNWFEFWQTDADIGTSNYNWTIWNCYDYNWNNTATCTKWSISMSSNTKANTWFTGTNLNWDSEYANIWWKFYTWANSASACPTWRHVPTEVEWTVLENYLAWSNCRTWDWWQCTWLWWKDHNTKTDTNNLANALKLPLTGNRTTNWSTFYGRWKDTLLWSSTGDTSNAYYRYFHSSTSSVSRINNSQLYGYSVRCIKDSPAQTECESADWFWVPPENDVTIGWAKGNGYCISPRIWDFGDSTWQWISWNWWWNQGDWNYNWWTPGIIDDTWNPASTYWQTRKLDTLNWYTCKALWTAISDYSVSDTMQWRMKWLSLNRNNLTELQNIDWITNALPPNGHTIPALYLADCIDWVKDLWTTMTYVHKDNTTDEVTYAEYNTNVTSNTELAAKSNVTYQNRQKYLTAWTQKNWSHLPSAMNHITSWYASATDSDWDFLTWTDRWEYQVACELWVLTDANDITDNEHIWISAIGNVDGGNWGRNGRVVVYGGCGRQGGARTGYRGGTYSTRFVVRSNECETAFCNQCKYLPLTANSKNRHLIWKVIGDDKCFIWQRFAMSNTYAIGDAIYLWINPWPAPDMGRIVMSHNTPPTATVAQIYADAICKNLWFNNAFSYNIGIENNSCGWGITLARVNQTTYEIYKTYEQLCQTDMYMFDDITCE